MLPMNNVLLTVCRCVLIIIRCARQAQRSTTCSVFGFVVTLRSTIHGCLCCHGLGRKLQFSASIHEEPTRNHPSCLVRQVLLA